MPLDEQILSLLDAVNDPGNETPATPELVKERLLLALSSGQGWSWTVSPVAACVEDLGAATVVLVVIDEDRTSVGAVSLESPVRGLLLCGAAWENELCERHGPVVADRINRLRAWCRVDADDRVSASTKDFLAWARA